MPTAHVEPPWLARARADMAANVKRIPGPEGHPRIIEYYEAVGLGHDGDDKDSFCGAGMGCWLKESGLPIPQNAYGAKQFETYGKGLDEPEPGAVMVFFRTPGRERDWQRHVTMFLQDLGSHYECLGANQGGGAVTISRFPKADLVPGAIRWPVAATVAALRDAGSKEIKSADNLATVAVTTVATGITGAITNQATATPPPAPPVHLPALPDIDLKTAAEQAGYLQKFTDASVAIGKLVGAHPWLLMTFVVAAGLGVVAWRLYRNRVAKAAAGVPLSNAIQAG